METMQAWLRSLLLVAHLQDWCFCEWYDKLVWSGEGGGGAPAASNWGTCCFRHGGLCPPSFTSLRSFLRLLRCRPERRQRRVVVWPLHGRKLYGCKTLSFVLGSLVHSGFWGTPRCHSFLILFKKKTFRGHILEQAQVLVSDRLLHW